MSTKRKILIALGIIVGIAIILGVAVLIKVSMNKNPNAKLFPIVPAVRGMLRDGPIDYLQSKEFCTSCHIMEKQGQTLESSKTLAGKHYQSPKLTAEQKYFICEECHTQGFIRDKVGGLKQVWAIIMDKDSQSKPLDPDVIRMNHLLPKEKCMHCHTDKSFTTPTRDDTKSSKALLAAKDNVSSKFVCAVCHVVHKERTDDEKATTYNTGCVSCHGNDWVTEHGNGDTCMTCHTKDMDAFTMHGHDTNMK